MAGKALKSLRKNDWLYLYELLSGFDGNTEFEFNQWVCNVFKPKTVVKHNNACKIQSVVAEALASSSGSGK